MRSWTQSRARAKPGLSGEVQPQLGKVCRSWGASSALRKLVHQRPCGSDFPASPGRTSFPRMLKHAESADGW